MASPVRVTASLCALLMILLVFQSVGARAHPPGVPGSDFNYALFASVAESLGWVEQATLDSVSSLGLGMSIIAGVSKISFRLFEGIFARISSDYTVIQRFNGLGLAIAGLILALIGSTTYARSGLARFLVDFFALQLTLGGFMVYEIQSQKPENQIADFVTPLGSAIEKYVVLGTPVATTGWMAYRAATGVYN